MPQVILTSDEYGTEEFDYDSLKDARAGFRELQNSCRAEAERDGIERRLLLAIETWVTE